METPETKTPAAQEPQQETTPTTAIAAIPLKPSKKLPALNKRERIFVRELLLDPDDRAGAIERAGYETQKKRTAEQCACELLKRPKIRRAMTELADELGLTDEVEIFRTIRETKRIAFFDPAKLFEADGTPKEIGSLDRETRAAIGGIDVVESWIGEGKTRHFNGYVKKYRMSSKREALDMLMRYYALYKDPGTKDNPLHMRIDWNKLSLEQLAQLRQHPELAYSILNDTRN